MEIDLTEDIFKSLDETLDIVNKDFKDNDYMSKNISDESLTIEKPHVYESLHEDGITYLNFYNENYRFNFKFNKLRLIELKIGHPQTFNNLGIKGKITVYELLMFIMFYYFLDESKITDDIIVKYIVSILIFTNNGTQKFQDQEAFDRLYKNGSGFFMTHVKFPLVLTIVNKYIEGISEHNLYKIPSSKLNVENFKNVRSLRILVIKYRHLFEFDFNFFLETHLEYLVYFNYIELTDINKSEMMLKLSNDDLVKVVYNGYNLVYDSGWKRTGGIGTKTFNVQFFDILVDLVISGAVKIPGSLVLNRFSDGSDVFKNEETEKLFYPT